ncbi:MAG: class I SAM-dependent methyltransferase [Patescibacteria group bacterium]|nr:class I SAM-dependent methyltransferase [Patescibacteria group bacterium]
MKKKQWWQIRYGTRKGIVGYFNIYKDILNRYISKQEVLIMLNFLKNHQFFVSYEDKILDGFCGNCRHSKELVLMGFRNIVAFDYSKEMLKTAKKNLESYNKNVVLINKDARNLTLSDSSFSLYFVLGNSAFGFFDNPKDDLKVAIEAYRIIKPDGAFVFDLVDYSYVIKQLKNYVYQSEENGIKIIKKRTTFKNNGLLRTEYNEIKFHSNKIIDNQIVRRFVYTNQQIINLLKKAGFKKIYIKKEAFCYEKNSDKYGTMGVRNLFLVKK